MRISVFSTGYVGLFRALSGRVRYDGNLPIPRS